ncbi:MAG: hypothetical protein KDD69_01075 [Bdellovibrionales bacterium]|nr:hypothetical protein [Bdellovibrionales bacterium]
MLNIRAYKIDDRVMVQYYDSGREKLILCPECHWRQSAEGVVSDDGCSSGEFSCHQCGMQLGVVATLRPTMSDEPRLF